MKKKITLLTGLALGVGAIIGTGIFGSLPEVINSIGDATIVALIGATIYVILMSLNGMYVTSVVQSSSIKFMTMTKIHHPLVGYLQTILAFLIPLLVSLYGILFADYFLVLFPAFPFSKVAISITLICVFMILAWFGNHSVAVVNNIFVIILLGTILLFSFAGLPHINLSKISFREAVGMGAGITAISAAIGVLSSSLMGAASIAEIGDDIDKPHKNIPRILIISPCIVAILYMFMTLVTLGCMPGAEVASLSEVAATFLSPTLVTVFVVGGPIAGILTSLVPVALVPVAVMDYNAKMRILPEIFSKKNKYGVPWFSLLVTSVITILILATGATFGPVMTAFSFANIAFTLPYTVMPLFLKKRYPNACKYSAVKLPHLLICIISVTACAYSCFTCYGLIANMNSAVWGVFIAITVAGYAYFVARCIYLKKKENYDLIKELQKPYIPWEERESMLSRENVR